MHHTRWYPLHFLLLLQIGLWICHRQLAATKPMPLPRNALHRNRCHFSSSNLSTPSHHFRPASASLHNNNNNNHSGEDRRYDNDNHTDDDEANDHATPVRQFYDPATRSIITAVHDQQQQQQQQQHQRQQHEQSPLLHPYFDGPVPVHPPMSTLPSCVDANGICIDSAGCAGGGCGCGGNGGRGGGGTCDDSTIDTRMSAATYQTYLFEYSPSSTLASKRLYEARMNRGGAVGGGGGAGRGGGGPMYGGPAFVSDPYTF